MIRKRNVTHSDGINTAYQNGYAGHFARDASHSPRRLRSGNKAGQAEGYTDKNLGTVRLRCEHQILRSKMKKQNKEAFFDARVFLLKKKYRGRSTRLSVS